MRKELCSQYDTASAQKGSARLRDLSAMTNINNANRQGPLSTHWSALTEASQADGDAGNTSTEVR